MLFPGLFVIPCMVMFGFAAASPAVSTPGSRIAQPPTEYTPSSARRAYGVDILKHPDWAGDFLLSDCEQARSYFKRRVAFYDPIKVLTVWSRRWTKEEPESPVETFELPFGYRYSESLPTKIFRQFVQTTRRDMYHPHSHSKRFRRKRSARRR